MKYKCKCKEFKVDKITIVIREGKAVAKETWCSDCKTYASELRTFDGWGKIISKPGGKA
tara:strand:+ start:383 stop:559 length:177 start_codon:yes stop_codon:yes gene_type:complete